MFLSSFTHCILPKSLNGTRANQVLLKIAFFVFIINL